MDALISVKKVLRVCAWLCSGVLLIPVIYLLTAMVITIVMGVALGVLVTSELVDKSSFEYLEFVTFSPASIVTFLFTLVACYWPLHWIWWKFEN